MEESKDIKNLKLKKFKQKKIRFIIIKLNMKEKILKIY